MSTSATGIKFELAPGKFVLYLSALIEFAMSQGNNISLIVKHFRREICAHTHHKGSSRSVISWLLMLTMISGPLQASVAMHSNLNTSGKQVQDLVTRFQEAAVTSEEHHCIAVSEYCQTPLSTCAAHFNCTPVSLPGPPQLAVQAPFYHHHPVVDVTVSTRFPDLPKRPPRS
jgi:hypothetical protein